MLRKSWYYHLRQHVTITLTSRTPPPNSQFRLSSSAARHTRATANAVSLTTLTLRLPFDYVADALTICDF